jgi:hypothetical protein
MKTVGLFFAGIFGVAVLVALGLGLRILLFPVHVLDKEIETGYGVVDKTLTAQNAIYNYEWFKQQYEDIRANAKKIENAQLSAADFRVAAGVRSDWTFEDKTEDARLQSIVLGLQNQQEQLVADYNARMKMANRILFKDTLLPPYLDAATFIKR